MTASKNLGDWLTENGGTDVNFGKTSYVAKIAGYHKKYNFDREFINEKTDRSSSGKTGTYGVSIDDIETGMVYEIRYDSWNNKHQRFVRVVGIEETDDGVELETESMSYEEVEEWVAETYTSQVVANTI